MELKQLISNAKVLASFADGNEALEDLIEEVNELTEDEIELDLNEIANFITFENCNHISYMLANGDRQDVAKALHAELDYWVNRDD